MRVRYLGGKTANRGRVDHQALSVAADYVVYAVRVRPQKVWLMLLVERSEPAWFDARDFDLVSNVVPSTWRIQIGADENAPTEFDLAPEPWLRPGFLKDYWNGGPAAAEARAIFEHEATLILRESCD